jgi:hypothetical protein
MMRFPFSKAFTEEAQLPRKELRFSQLRNSTNSTIATTKKQIDFPVAFRMPNYRISLTEALHAKLSNCEPAEFVKIAKAYLISILDEDLRLAKTHLKYGMVFFKEGKLISDYKFEFENPLLTEDNRLYAQITEIINSLSEDDYDFDELYVAIDRLLMVNVNNNKFFADFKEDVLDVLYKTIPYCKELHFHFKKIYKHNGDVGVIYDARMEELNNLINKLGLECYFKSLIDTLSSIDSANSSVIETGTFRDLPFRQMVINVAEATNGWSEASRFKEIIDILIDDLKKINLENKIEETPRIIQKVIQLLKQHHDSYNNFVNKKYHSNFPNADILEILEKELNLKTKASKDQIIKSALTADCELPVQCLLPTLITSSS